MVTLTLSLATLLDIPHLASLQRLAFASVPVQAACFGHLTPAQEDAWTSVRLVKAVESRGEEVWKAVLDEEVVGFAVWVLPKQMEEEEGEVVVVQETEQERRERRKSRFPEGTDYDLASALFSPLGVKEPHFHLSRLATSPLHQRKGIASALLRQGCIEADSQGVDIYLKASEVGIPLYQRFGFHFFGAAVGSPTDPVLRLHPMRRPPLLITPPHLTDLPSLATLHQLAFWPSHFFQQMFDSSTHRVRPSDWKAWHLGRLERWAEEGEKGGHVIAVAKRGETVLGYGHFTVHEHGEEGEEEEYPEGTDVEAARSVFGGMEAVESLIPGKFVVLHQLATDPLHQKTGAGRALLRWFIDKARSMGFDDLYLQATPAGQHLYDSMGFKQFAPTIVSVRGVEIYPMVHCFRE